jgi:hypothetical protein
MGSIDFLYAVYQFLFLPKLCLKLMENLVLISLAKSCHVL